MSGDEDRVKSPEELDRFQAEAEKFRAEAEEARARTKLTQLDHELALIHQEEARQGLAIGAIGLARSQRDERKLLAANEYHHLYAFQSEVGDASVHHCMNQLQQWERNEPGCDIHIVFSSPGGSIIAGLELYDYLQTLKRARMVQGEVRPPHFITTTALGMAASMAGILLQAGNVREMGRESYILIHQVSFLAYGKIGVVEDEVRFMQKIQSRVLDIFAARSKEAGENGTASHPFSRQEFAERWERKDWWLDSQEALDGGVVDVAL